jgi:hypothetical protein
MRTAILVACCISMQALAVHGEHWLRCASGFHEQRMRCSPGGGPHSLIMADYGGVAFNTA